MRLRPLPAFSDNYIWTLADDDGAAVVVDPGEAGPVLQASAQGLRPHTVLLTHHHPDHVGGVAELRERWPALAVIASDDDRILDATARVGDGDTVDAGSWRFRVLSVPGHTRSHVAFFGEDLLFCGDTLFSLGCGHMFEGEPAQMLASLDRLAALPGNTAVCCGHEYTLANAAFALHVDPGNSELQARAASAAAERAAGRPTLPSRVDAERAANPFLRVDAEAVQASVARRIGHAPKDRIDVFAELRCWKDDFQA